MSHAALIALLLGFILAGSTTTRAQQKFPPDKFVNLQVFPKDVTPDVLITAMKTFTRGLGVRCQFCHVGEEGMPLEKFDFVADTKPQKQTARMMIRIVGEINAQITKAITDAPAKGYQVTCYTCHRGAQHPQHSPDAPKPPGSLRGEANP